MKKILMFAVISCVYSCTLCPAAESGVQMKSVTAGNLVYAERNGLLNDTGISVSTLSVASTAVNGALNIHDGSTAIDIAVTGTYYAVESWSTNQTGKMAAPANVTLATNGITVLVAGDYDVEYDLSATGQNNSVIEVGIFVNGDHQNGGEFNRKISTGADVGAGGGGGQLTLASNDLVNIYMTSSTVTGDHVPVQATLKLTKISSGIGVSSSQLAATSNAVMSVISDNAYDVSILQAADTTLASAIDDRYGDNVTVVEDTGNAQENGTNLLAVVDALSLAGGDPAYVMLAACGYDLPSTLTISNRQINLMSTLSVPVASIIINGVVADLPIIYPATSVTGDITIVNEAATQKIIIDGIFLTGDLSVPGLGTDSITPPILQNSLILGNVATSEDTCLNLIDSFVTGTFCTGDGLANGKYGGNIIRSTIIGDDSIQAPLLSQTGRNLFKDSYFKGSGCFQSRSRSGAYYFDGCIVESEGLFELGSAETPVIAYDTTFVNTRTNASDWEGVKDEALTVIKNCTGVHTNVSGLGSANILNSFDKDYNSL